MLTDDEIREKVLEQKLSGEAALNRQLKINKTYINIRDISFLSFESQKFFVELKEDKGNNVNVYGINRNKNYYSQILCFLLDACIDSELPPLDDEFAKYIKDKGIPNHIHKPFYELFSLTYKMVKENFEYNHYKKIVSPKPAISADKTLYKVVVKGEKCGISVVEADTVLKDSNTIRYFSKAEDAVKWFTNPYETMSEVFYEPDTEVNIDDIDEIIKSSFQEFLKRLAADKNEEFINVIEKNQDVISDFNNSNLLSVAQKYVRHTNLLYNKMLAKLFLEILMLYGKPSNKIKLHQDKYGKQIQDAVHKRTFHFIPNERVLSFQQGKYHREVNIDNINSTFTSTNILLVKNNAKSQEILNRLNRIINLNIYFTTIENFVKSYFGKDVWNLIECNFDCLEKEIQNNKLFDLTDVCNVSNIKAFKLSIQDAILKFPYIDVLSQLNDSADLKSVFDIYLSKKKYSVLMEEHDFSRSFITAEWLFKNYMNNDYLDKTYIAASYLKSIEQLLVFLIETSAFGKKIKVLDKGGFSETVVGSPEYYKATLGNLSHFLRDGSNSSIYENSISRKSRNLILQVLDEWIKNERNGYFHKHNISCIDTIISIRNKTILLYALLLGAIEFNE